MQQVKFVLVDINPKMVSAFRETFEENPEIAIVQGSMLEQKVSAWVSPTNSFGNMDGGLDAVIKNHLGGKVQQALKQEIATRYGSTLPVGHATCVQTGRPVPRFLISTPTMVKSSEDISDSLNVALACAAALQAVHMQNAKEPGSITSVALPGLGANTGRVPVEICADLMWTAYHLYLRKAFTDFKEMRAALEEELGDLDAGAGKKKGTSVIAGAAVAAGAGAAAAAVSTKKTDIDFDDHEAGGGGDDDEEDEDDDDEEDEDDDESDKDEDFDDHE
jgi:O-acetyl-ADP-ribose deacetylase (regulator of RNase III)